MSTTIEWNQIERRLNTCEQIITGLFSLDFFAHELKEKLCQLEEWIVHIPDNQPELIQEWNRKLVNWWMAFAAASYQQRQQEQSKQCHCTQSERYRLSNELSSFEHASNLSSDNKPTNGSIPNLPSKSNESNSSINSQDLADVRLSKQTVLDQMEHAFAQLSPVTECSNVPEYLDRLTQLATLVAKARSLASTIPADHTLPGTMFTYAFAKMSSKLKQSYRQQYGLRFSSLFVLAKFLTEQIRDYIQQDNEKRILINIDDIFCVYCKKSGHLSGNCPEIRAMMCKKCFKMGHLKKDCI